MATDFFQRQDAARRQTGRLLVLYALGVAALVLAVYAVVVALVAFTGDRAHRGHVAWWQPQLLLLTSLGVGAVVGLGSAWKVAELAKGGGRGVAELLGGREVPANTPDPALRRLLNVVEEMSLAAGCRLPSVYVLEDEAGINAFAAGFKTDEAVVAVSRGCLDYLTRDELQGVVAHEFSHILNGDMKRNLRLMGLLHGLLVLSLVGELVCRVAGSGSSNSSSNDKGDGVRWVVVVLGVALMVLGWVGVLFGRVIQAAVSRQREYLADASAVQFTRYPDGIAGALKKIGGLDAGSALATPQAGEAAHLFFADGIRSRLLDPFASHPPLADRVRRIDPRFDGAWPRVVPLAATAEPAPSRRGRAKPVGGLPTVPGLPNVPIPVLPLAANTAGGGAITPPALTDAADLYAGLPDDLRDAAGEPFGARALVLALLFDDRPEIRAKQAAAVAARGDPLLAAETARLAERVGTISDAARLPLTDLSIAALRQMSAAQYADFRGQVTDLIAADGRLTAFEYALRTVVLTALDRRFRRTAPPYTGGTREAMRPKLVPLLSALAAESGAGRAEAFAKGVEAYKPGGPPLTPLPAGALDLAAFDAALQAFAAAPSVVRRAVVAACVATVRADAAVTVREAELLRAVVAALDIPFPVQYASA